MAYCTFRSISSGVPLYGDSINTHGHVVFGCDMLRSNKIFFFVCFCVAEKFFCARVLRTQQQQQIALFCHMPVHFDNDEARSQATACCRETKQWCQFFGAMIIIFFGYVIVLGQAVAPFGLIICQSDEASENVTAAIILPLFALLVTTPIFLGNFYSVWWHPNYEKWCTAFCCFRPIYHGVMIGFPVLYVGSLWTTMGLLCSKRIDIAIASRLQLFIAVAYALLCIVLSIAVRFLTCSKPVQKEEMQSARSD